MKILLILTGVAEAATGVALLAAPALVGRLLLGADLVGVSAVVARVAGIALLALGVGCWPGPASLGMLTYSTLATVYLAHLALGGEWIGPFLWPAVVLHAVITILLGRAWLMNPKTGGRNTPASEQ